MGREERAGAGAAHQVEHPRHHEDEQRDDHTRHEEPVLARQEIVGAREAERRRVDPEPAEEGRRARPAEEDEQGGDERRGSDHLAEHLQDRGQLLQGVGCRSRRRGTGCPLVARITLHEPSGCPLPCGPPFAPEPVVPGLGTSVWGADDPGRTSVEGVEPGVVPSVADPDPSRPLARSQSSCDSVSTRTVDPRSARAAARSRRSRAGAVLERHAEVVTAARRHEKVLDDVPEPFHGHVLLRDRRDVDRRTCGLVPVTPGPRLTAGSAASAASAASAVPGSPPLAPSHHHHCRRRRGWSGMAWRARCTRTAPAPPGCPERAAASPGATGGEDQAASSDREHLPSARAADESACHGHLPRASCWLLLQCDS